MSAIEKSRTARMIKHMADGAFRLLAVFMAFCLLLMLLLVFGNVVMRYGFNSGIMISEEVARMAFVWLIFIGSVLAFRAKQHLSVNMLVSRFSVTWQKIIHIIRQLLILAVLWLLIYGGWEQTIIGFSTVTPVSGVPIAIFSGAVFLSAVAMAIMIVADLLVAVRAPATPDNILIFQTSYDSIDDV